MEFKCNPRERQFQEDMLAQGFEVYSRGWPDFLVYDRKRNKVKFVEIKRKQKPSPKMGLSIHQKTMIEILRGIGLDVSVQYL